MGARFARRGLTWAVMVLFAAGGLLSGASGFFGVGPRDALALDQDVATCDWATFNPALDAVQADGGGTITITCSGTIVFAGEKTITTPVTIVATGAVILDGNDATRLFVVNSGGSLELENLTLTNGRANHGGVIFNNSGGSVTITNSTFVNNVVSDSAGGAIYNEGTLTISTSTFNGNSASYGGAVSNQTGATANIIASTFAGNSVSQQGGALDNFGGTATIQTSIFANNTAVNGGSNCQQDGTLTSLGYNLSNDTSCVFTATGDIQNSANIDLGPLQDNGGLTQTMMPLPTSDAIDAADCSLSTPTDQRGAARPTTGTLCDIGAVEVGAVLPVAIESVVVTNEPVSEGAAASIEATTTNPGSAVLSYSFDCDNDTVYETPGTGTGTTGTGSCSFADDGVFTVGVQVCDDGTPATCDEDTLDVTVLNVAPVIEGITIGPVSQGQPVTVTVNASDVPADTLSYRFDCADDGSFEIGPQPGSSTVCPLDPTAAQTTIIVEVSDEDGGVSTDSIVISQSATVCADSRTGAVSASRAGGCPSGSFALTVPSSNPMTFCINPYTGALSWSRTGACGSGYRTHVVPDNGPLHYCQNIYTSKLRYTATGGCSTGERAGVIPG